MSNLFVLKFADENTPQQVLGTMKQLQDQRLMKVDDAAMLTFDQKGRPRIKQANNLVGAGALGGAFWGMLIGMLFLMPFLGAAVGAASGALAGKFSDMGINDEFIKNVGNSLKPGQSALFLLVSDAVADKVLPQLKQYKFEVIQTSLSRENEVKLRDMLGTTSTTA